MGECVGYARVSSDSQNLARQEAALAAAGVSRPYLYVEVASGKNADRPKLAEVVRYVRDGDELVVPSMDRLARSLPDLLDLVEQITAKGCTIRFLNPPLTFTGDDDPVGKLMLGLLGAIAAFERDLLLQRQREGIAEARKRNDYKGRKPTDPAKLDKARDLVAAGVPVTEAARQVGVSRVTLHRAGIRSNKNGVQMPLVEQ